MGPQLRAVYTVVLGDYEDLNEIVIPKEEGIDYICLTDDPNLESTTWEVKLITPEFPGDSVRSQRLLKILGHSFLEKYSETLYVDNSVLLKRPASEFIDFLLEKAAIAIPLHSFRHTVDDEFIEVMNSLLDSPERLEEQLSHYKTSYPDSLALKPFWTAIIARRQSSEIKRFSEIWANQVLRYSRRDQLSVRIAQAMADIDIREIPLDNWNSTWHEWPILTNRLGEVRLFSRATYDFEFAQLLSRIETVEKEYLSLKSLLDVTTRERDELFETKQKLIESKSWKYSAPLRALMRGIHRARGK